MTLTDAVAKNIIRKLFKGDDYRIEIVTLINAQFLQFSIEFFKKIVAAKLANEEVTPDWYKKEFLNPQLTKSEIAIHSGLNMKTIGNMFNSTTKKIVIDASNEHYDNLYAVIQELVEVEKEIDLTLTIKLNGVSVDLNISETLIVINTLAVKRAALRGGLWSTAGKRVEKPLMQCLCQMYNVSPENYAIKVLRDSETEEAATFEREIDFYLVKDKINYKCEVKLMGQGNPESADAVIARASAVFVADKLSDTNKAQLDSLKVGWVELRSENGWRRFKQVLESLEIPHNDFNGDVNSEVEKILNAILREEIEVIPEVSDNSDFEQMRIVIEEEPKKKK